MHQASPPSFASRTITDALLLIQRVTIAPAQPAALPSPKARSQMTLQRLVQYRPVQPTRLIAGGETGKGARNSPGVATRIAPARRPGLLDPHVIPYRPNSRSEKPAAEGFRKGLCSEGMSLETSTGASNGDVSHPTCPPSHSTLLERPRVRRSFEGATKAPVQRVKIRRATPWRER